MRKVTKASKAGFSLVEMVMVLAIIVIIASVLCFNYFQVFKHIIEVI